MRAVTISCVVVFAVLAISCGVSGSKYETNSGQVTPTIDYTILDTNPFKTLTDEEKSKVLTSLADKYSKKPNGEPDDIKCLTAEQLVKAFKTNEVGSIAKFGDKPIMIVGEVKKVKASPISISLYATTFLTLDCLLDADVDLKSIAKFEQGDLAIVAGKVQGTSLVNLRITNAIVETYPPKK